MTRVEILTIGDELLDGRLIDSNSALLSDALLGSGFAVARHQSVRDERSEIVAALRECAARAAVVLVSGGLGPTSDDLTAACAAAAFGRRVVRHQEALDHVQRFFARLGREMSPNNEQQADLPEGCRILPNPWGTAVGFALDEGGCRLYFMPGVPRELQNIFAASVLPELEKAGLATPPLVASLRLFGAGESDVADRLEGRGGPLPGAERLTLQYRASFPEIHLRLLVSAAADAEAVLAAAVSEAQARLGELVFAAGDGRLSTSFAEVVRDELMEHGVSAAVAEGFSGGRAASLLRSASGASSSLRGAVVAENASARARLLGLAETAEGDVASRVLDMATGIREIAGADLGLAVDGEEHAGAGWTVHVALADARRSQTWKRKLSFDRRRMERLAAHLALAQLRLFLHSQ